MLDGLPILIVEDEPLVALDLALSIQDLHGFPVGPVATVAEALALLKSQTVGAAIVDANLLDRDVTPLALALFAEAVPFVVHTGTGLPEELAITLPDIAVVMKPAAPTIVIAALLRQISADRA